MPEIIQVGTLLVKAWPPKAELLGLQSEPCSGSWSLVQAHDGRARDRKIHAAGWNFFFMAAEVKATFLGALGAKKMQNALRRILKKVEGQHFNGIEITEIVAKRFLGVPYTVVSAHSRHLQESPSLDDLEARWTLQSAEAWARA